MIGKDSPVVFGVDYELSREARKREICRIRKSKQEADKEDHVSARKTVRHVIFHNTNN